MNFDKRLYGWDGTDLQGYSLVGCCECRKSARGVPQIKHHKKCLTGQKEDARRDNRIHIPPKPRPFRIPKGATP